MKRFGTTCEVCFGSCGTNCELTAGTVLPSSVVTSCGWVRPPAQLLGRDHTSKSSPAECEWKPWARLPACASSRPGSVPLLLRLWSPEHRNHAVEDDATGDSREAAAEPRSLNDCKEQCRCSPGTVTVPQERNQRLSLLHSSGVCYIGWPFCKSQKL